MSSAIHREWDASAKWDVSGSLSSKGIFPYLYRTPQGKELFIVQGIIEGNRSYCLKKLFGEAHRYQEFKWPRGIEILTEDQCLKIAEAYSNDNVWLGSKLQRQFERIFGENKPSEQLRPLNPQINSKLFIDPRCEIQVDENTRALEITKLYCCILLTDDDLKYIADHFPNLMFIILSHCSEITDDGLFHLQKLSKLEYIDLCFSFEPKGDSSFTNITNKGLSYLANFQLRYLDLDRFYNLTDETIAIFKNCPLEYFCINSSKITDEGMSLMASFFPNLKALIMSNCSEVTVNGLVFLKKLPLLDKLETHYCEKIPNHLGDYFNNKEEINRFFIDLEVALNTQSS